MISFNPCHNPTRLIFKNYYTDEKPESNDFFQVTWRKGRSEISDWVPALQLPVALILAYSSIHPSVSSLTSLGLTSSRAGPCSDLAFSCLECSFASWQTCFPGFFLPWGNCFLTKWMLPTKLVIRITWGAYWKQMPQYLWDTLIHESGGHQKSLCLTSSLCDSNNQGKGCHFSQFFDTGTASLIWKAPLALKK